MQRYLYFTEDELRCRCGKCSLGQNDMDPFFMSKLTAMRIELDFPFPISSAIRCHEWNLIVAKREKGAHTLAHAVDITIHGGKAYEIISAAKKFGFTGIGIRQHGVMENRFIHLDDLTRPLAPRPMVWSYP